VELQGEAVNPQPMLVNACYAFVGATLAMHAASVYRFVAEQRRFEQIPATGGASAAWTELEARYALSWARNIWADMLG
jgi:hypothetical protein